MLFLSASLVISFVALSAQVMLGHLKQHGYDVSDDLEDAEVLIVNTCSFVDEAKAESLEVRPYVVFLPNLVQLVYILQYVAATMS